MVRLGDGILRLRPAGRRPSSYGRSRWVALFVGLGLILPARAGTQDEPAEPEFPRMVPSGFATLGWAQSNRDWAYQRFIDAQGTARADSLVGAQLDVMLTSSLSAVVQAKFAHSNREDAGWRVRPTWAFLAWRSANDWLLRAGKLRIPAYLRSEHLDVGSTYDQARLPAEVYGILPSEDLDSFDLTRSWAVGGAAVDLDIYGGRTRQTTRLWMRDGAAGTVPQGAMYVDMTTRARGAVLTWNGSDSKARLGFHRVAVTPPSQMAIVVRPTWVALGDGIGYWQTDPQVPGPGVETIESATYHYVAAGVDFSPLPGWRLTGEFSRLNGDGGERLLDTRGGYLTLTRRLGRWSPYATWARLLSSARNRAWTRTLDEAEVPATVPGAELLHTSMQVGADTGATYDQVAWAVGTSWAATPNRKLKAEWLHTRAEVSSMFDLPPGSRLFQRRSVDVLSVNFNLSY